MQLSKTQKKALNFLHPTSAIGAAELAKKLHTLPGPAGRCLVSLTKKKLARSIVKNDKKAYTRTAEGTKAIKN